MYGTVLVLRVSIDWSMNRMTNRIVKDYLACGHPKTQVSSTSCPLVNFLFPFALIGWLLALIMEDDLLLVLLTMRALWPASFSSSSLYFGSLPDWSVSLMAAYRLAEVISAALVR